MKRRMPSGEAETAGQGRRRWPVWTKVGSLIGTIVLAVVLALASGIGQRLLDAVLPPSDSSSEQGDDAPPAAEARLVLSPFEPPDVDLTCDHDVNVAGLNDASDPSGLSSTESELSPAGDPRTRAVDQLGAITWYRNLIHLGLSTADEKPVFIMRIEPVVFDHETIAPAWGLEFKPPCGGTAQFRVFRVVLDQGSIEDMGLVGLEPGEDTPTEPLGQSFTVSANDPALVVIQAYACAGYFEWGLKITYVASDDLKYAWFGTEDEPLQMIGGWQGVERYHAEWDGDVRIVPGPAKDPTKDPARPADPGIPSSAADVCT